MNDREMSTKKILFAAWLLWFLLLHMAVAQVEAGTHFPDWEEGFLDIHHIYTGRGEAVFAILPDGTTMLIDAGETGTDKRNFRPDASRGAGEWISRYILRMIRPLSEKRVDYILLTHFHDDHMGNIGLSDRRSDKGGYILTGITELGDLIPFGKIVDRNWPHYNYPRLMSDNANLQNYIRFVNWHVENGATAEAFKAGSNGQFRLLKQPGRYPEFEIRNIAANGEVWTGRATNTRNYFPPVDQLTEREYPEENLCSAAIRISYGKFDYFNGGDILHSYAPGTWKDLETPVGMALGKVDVCEANHHAKDAMGKGFLQAVQPRVIVVQGFALSHPDATALRNMLSKEIYPGDRDIFLTHLFDVNRTVLGEKLISQLKSTGGHVVVRVRPGGDSYQIYVLDDTSESYTIKGGYGPYESN